METTNCPEMLVRDYSTLCNISEECISHDDLVMQDLVWLCHDTIQSDPVWCGLVRCFICKFKMTSHI